MYLTTTKRYIYFYIYIKYKQVYENENVFDGIAFLGFPYEMYNDILIQIPEVLFLNVRMDIHSMDTGLAYSEISWLFDPVRLTIR